jgi:ribosomal protein S18 acetylase RimI-like enzyme
MAEIEGDLVAFDVNPRAYQPVRRFRCGDGDERAEREVNKMARDYATGKRQCPIFRVLMEQPIGQVVGIVAIHPANFSQPALAPINGFPYISVIGVSAEYRGMRKEGLRPGDHVLRDALRVINGAWGGVPDIFALVDPKNQPSCALFGRHGFEVVIHAEPGNEEADSLFGRPGGPTP